MLLTDKEISKLAENDLLMPYVGEKRRRLDNGIKAISYGLSQAGYDIRLSDKQFLVFNGKAYRAADRPILDPKMLDCQPYEAVLNHGDGESWYILPPHSFGLGVSVERFTMPNDVFALCEGKSTYGRIGLIANILPIEPGWTGYLTMCLVNPTSFPLKLYVNEGIAQIVFFRCGTVDKPYEGHYQDQGARVQLAAV
jgi:dCTP deaminase